MKKVHWGWAIGIGLLLSVAAAAVFAQTASYTYRATVPQSVADVIDQEAAARGLTPDQMAAQALSEWVQVKAVLERPAPSIQPTPPSTPLPTRQPTLVPVPTQPPVVIEPTLAPTAPPAATPTVSPTPTPLPTVPPMALPTPTAVPATPPSATPYPTPAPVSEFSYTPRGLAPDYQQTAYDCWLADGTPWGTLPEHTAFAWIKCSDGAGVGWPQGTSNEMIQNSISYHKAAREAYYRRPDTLITCEESADDRNPHRLIIKCPGGWSMGFSHGHLQDVRSSAQAYLDSGMNELDYYYSQWCYWQHEPPLKHEDGYMVSACP